MKTKDQQLSELADGIGDFIQYWGFRKIHGRVWTLIYLSKTPIETGDLLELTDVSKGLMSTTITTLLDYNLIVECCCDNNKKKKCYRANIDIGPVITAVLKKREKEMLKKISDCYGVVSKNAPEWVDERRLKRMGKYIQYAGALLSAVIKFGSFSFSDWKALERKK